MKCRFESYRDDFKDVGLLTVDAGAPDSRCLVRFHLTSCGRDVTVAYWTVVPGEWVRIPSATPYNVSVVFNGSMTVFQTAGAGSNPATHLKEGQAESWRRHLFRKQASESLVGSTPSPSGYAPVV